MTATTIRLDRQGAVAILTLDRPEVLNSFDTTMAAELVLAAAELASDATIGAVVVTGAGGKAFCAGADIAEFGALSSPDDFHGFIRRLSRAVEAIGALPQPVIAAVEGVAFGGGCELAMACDIRTASERTRFGLPEIKLGLLPGLGGTQRAIRLLPIAVATRMLITGDPISAAEGHLVGFCEPPTPVGGALEAAIALAERLSEGPRSAMAAAKDLIRRGRELTLDDAIALEQQTGRRLFGTTDAAEGVGAFLDKRRAVFGAR